ncbi:MAG: prepilin-type N-terminal cleavage/methylation domain-containing protein [Phycisphaerales bacterium]|nr:prepilin-type N-terminal cleavage/methylation domain-containing protein [Phycisphaerales bacterium]
MSTASLHARRSRRAAFTLVELLVVISIIALLIAILLPSLKKARAQAKDVVCKANLHSVGQAFTMYAESYRGVWPPAVDTYQLQNRWPVPFHESGIITAQLAEYDANGKVKRGGDESIFLCPAERAERAIPDWRGTGEYVDRVTVGGSYALNEEIHRKGGKLERGYFPPPTAVPPYLNKIDNCRRAGAVIAVIDNAIPIQTVTSPGWRFHRGYTPGLTDGENMDGAFFAGYRMYDGSDFPPAYRSIFEKFRIIGGRHGGHANALMIDTHVEALKPDNIAYNQVSWDRWDGDPTKVPGGH